MENNKNKFRVYDVRNEKYLTTQRELNDLLYQYSHETNNPNPQPDFIGFQDIEGIIKFEQFTGMLDVDGREIYEGDTLFSDQWNPSKYLVMFGDGGFYLADPLSKFWVVDINRIYDSTGVHFSIVDNPKQIKLCK